MLIPPTIWPFRPPSSNSNLQTGSAQQHGKRVREGGEVLCLPANTEQCVSIQLKFYFWLSHNFLCMCDIFWAKWEPGNFSIFLQSNDAVGLWWISQLLGVCVSPPAKLDSAVAVVKGALKWLLAVLVQHFCHIVELAMYWSALQHPLSWAKTTQNFEDALRHWQIKWINWGEVVEKRCHFIGHVVFLFQTKSFYDLL